MKVIRGPRQLQQTATRLLKKGKSIGFVPTMGAFHEGHLSLVRAAGRENDIIIASIFVNPTQFGSKEDLKKYPRPFRADVGLLKNAGVDFLFYPSIEAMYPQKPGGHERTAFVSPSGLASVLCGKFRPGHFRGVATVVLKFFNIVKPTRAYFGQKDYQQCVVIKNMVRDLDLDVQVKALPTVREKDGLAMSSRNRYLSAAERERARYIYKTLLWLRSQILPKNGFLAELGSLRRQAINRLAPHVDKIQYLEIVDAETLESLKRPQEKMVALTACFVGKTRLIDNVIIHPSKEKKKPEKKKGRNQK